MSALVRSMLLKHLIENRRGIVSGSDWEIRVIINILKRTGFTFHAQILRDFLDERKHQDSGLDQADNRFLLRLADCLHPGEEDRLVNTLTNKKCSKENLPGGPSLLKPGFSELTLLIQRAYILLDEDC